jgi:nucleoside-diphosphate-sugar epimerase
MRVLITGASGFIGSHVTRLLVANGHEVSVILRESSSLWRIEDILNSIRVIRCDLGSMVVSQHIREIHPELCIHLAWYTEPGKYANSLENIASLQMSLSLLSQLAEVGCKQFIGVGTCFEYDFSLGYFSEDSATNPWSLYAATKIAFSTVLQQFEFITGMEISWVRLFYQYGPMEDERRLIAGIITSLLKDKPVKITKGEQVRDFLHVEDMAAAILAVAQSHISGIINIGSGKPVTVKEIALNLGSLLEKSNLIQVGALPYRENDPMFVCSNNDLLKEKTDWKPKYTLTSGLKDTINWYKTKF